MSRGLGTMQRLMLFRLADHEVWLAETASELRRLYRSPDRWSLADLIYSLADDALYDTVTTNQRADHERWQATLRAFSAGDERAREQFALVVNISARLRKPNPSLTPTAFEPSRPRYRDLQRFNPSRALAGLVRGGFVLRGNYCRVRALALTAKGFAEARRLGGVPDSAIVDLDGVQANWRAPNDFLLGFTGLVFRDDDADAIRSAERAAAAVA